MKMIETIELIVDTLFSKPATKHAMSIMGKAGVESRSQKAVVSDAAEMVLSSPQLAGIKMVAEQVGFDIDAMVEKHGPAGALQGFTQLLAMLGIKLPDVLGALTSGEGIGSLLSGAPQTSGGKNPYLQG